MGKLPLYANHIAHKELHRGLLFDKFFDYSTLGKKPTEQDKKGFLEEFKNAACGDAENIKSFATKQLNLIESIGGTAMTYSTQWHFVTGMGIDHPLENGMAWHHTLGTPYIAGSGVKGMFRAYLWEWADVEKAKILRWCGYTKEEAKEYGLDGESAGELIFFDAIPTAPVTLTPDVMTPHMGDWYEKGGENKHDAKNTPADWHNPVPILFLAVKKATFLFGVASRAQTSKEELQEAMKYLGEALEFVGAGAKTAAGYGRFALDEKSKKELKETEEAAKLAQLSPLEQKLAKLSSNIPELVNTLEKGEFGDDTKEAALKIQQIMKDKKGEWDEKGDPNKTKAAKRTQKVAAVLKKFTSVS